MNRHFSHETEAELLRAAEAHPGQGLVLGADGIARPAQAPDWAVLGPKLVEALRGVEGLLYEAQSDIPAEMRAKRDVLAALEIVRANLPAA